MALNLRETLLDCQHLTDEQFGRLLREQLTWEVGKGMSVGKPISYYLLKIKRRWDVRKERRLLPRPGKEGAQPIKLSALIQAAMEAQG